MSKFSERTLKSLSDAGWRPGLRVDVSKYIAAYERVGHPIFPRVILFLEQYGDLKLSYPHFRDPDLVDSCNFHADIAARIEPAWIREYEEHVRQRLVPIGAARREHLDLLMTAEGVIYATYEDLVWFVGNDFVSALNALCDGHELDCSQLEEAEEPIVSDDLTDTVKKRLADAGWTSDRSIPFTSSTIGEDGSDEAISPEVRRFIQEYGKLLIKTEPGGEFDVNPVIANETLDKSHKREICLRLGLNAITPIGVVQPGAITVIMDEQGRMFGILPGIPDWLVKFGDNQIAGLNAVVSGVGAVDI